MPNVDTLLTALAERARQLGLTVEVDPSELLERRLLAEAISESLGSAARTNTASAGPADTEIDGENLPERARALTMGHHSILIGALGEDVGQSVVHDHLRRWHNQAVIARSWLGARSDDLLLVLIGPPRSGESDRWKRIAQEIERNERVCRKLIWLPPVELAEQPASLEMFLGRTCLARPWVETGDGQAPEAGDGQSPVAAQVALDALSDLAADLAAELEDDPDGRALTETKAREWLDLLAREDIDREDMLEALVRTLIAVPDVGPENSPETDQ
ncbi:ABC-three component system middle component 1 [Azospirillum palustre]